MKFLKYGMMAVLALLVTSVSAKEEAKKSYMFKVDSDFKTNVVDTIPCGEKNEAYEDAREWFSSAEWDSYNTFNEVSPESFDFSIDHKTKVRVNIMTNTTYIDYIQCSGNITFYNGYAVFRMNDIQLGEKVIGWGAKNNIKPMTHKLRKIEKLEKEKEEIAADPTIKSKQKKDRIEDIEDEIDDVRSTLDLVQEEIEKRLVKLRKAIK